MTGTRFEAIEVAAVRADAECQLHMLSGRPKPAGRAPADGIDRISRCGSCGAWMWRGACRTHPVTDPRRWGV
jgi:hypothetical protein